VIKHTQINKLVLFVGSFD